ncbi:MAG: acetyltransferase [Negativicutes bacterium]|jgi:UDP-perosamine 4-acetyltransferase
MNNKELPIIVLGAGGHAKVLIDVLKLMQVNIIGIAERNDCLKKRQLLGISIIGDDDDVLLYSPDEVLLVNGLGSTRSLTARKTLFDKFCKKGYCFARVIHPSAIIAGDVVIGEGSQIMAGSVIQTGTVIGNNTIVNTRASIDHDCIIGDSVHVASGAILSGDVKIGDCSHVGAGAIVIQGISIGTCCLIAAGAVVINQVEPKTTIVGVPGRRVLQ